jgi:hypothetical protein
MVIGQMGGVISRAGSATEGREIIAFEAPVAYSSRFSCG